MLQRASVTSACCSVTQYAAESCSVLQCVAARQRDAGMLQGAVASCSMLQCVAVCYSVCSILQHASVTHSMFP